MPSALHLFLNNRIDYSYRLITSFYAVTLLCLTQSPQLAHCIKFNKIISPTQAISNLRGSYEVDLGHAVLTPALEDPSVTPVEASQCTLSLARQCYVPLPQLVSWFYHAAVVLCGSPVVQCLKGAFRTLNQYMSAVPKVPLN